MEPCQHELRQRFSFYDYLFYTGMLAVPLLTATLAIGTHSRWGLIAYLLLALAAAGLVMKFYCSRCPHYTRDDRRLRCMFFWNLPKVFPARPGDLDTVDKLVAFAAPAAVLGFPLFWLYREPVLLLIYAISGAVFAAAVRRLECHRCIYFACPMNNAPQDP